MQMNDKIILGPDSKLHNNERSYHTIPTLEIIFGINLINLEGKIILAFANASLIIYFVFYFLPVTYIVLWSI
jgi:hypothetical protein